MEGYYRIHVNAHQMLHDRKYTELVSGKKATTYEEFCEMFVNNGTLDKDGLNFIRMRNDTDFISVFFTNDESIGIKSIITIAERMTANKIQHSILVYPKNLTASAKKYMEKTNKLRIEAFSEDELRINITKHELMPVHQVLTAQQKAEFLTSAKLNEEQLAKISGSDPVAKYYGMRRGDVVRIIRRSDTAGKSVTFRVCG